MEGSFSIMETGKYLTDLVAEALNQEFGLSREKVGMGIPGEDSQLSFCIFPYDICRNAEMHTGEAVAIGSRSLREASGFYDICFMLVPYSDSDLKYRREEELRFLDLMLQKLGDTHYLGEKQTAFSLCSLEFEEKAKIWNAINQPIRLALYCKAGPVEVISGKTKEIHRVTDVRMHYTEKGE